MTSSKIAPRSPVSPGDVLAGKYRVERVLGMGGMGIVAAMHLELEERVALKFLRGGVMDEPDIGVRFQREARAVAKLKSEHVARVRDIGKLESGAPYIVMEHLDGETLKERVQRQGALPVAEAVDYILQACDAIKPGIEGALTDVVARCLRREPSERFANVAELARALEPFGSEASHGAAKRVSSVLRVRVAEPAPRALLAERPTLTERTDVSFGEISEGRTTTATAGAKRRWPAIVILGAAVFALGASALLTRSSGTSRTPVEPARSQAAPVDAPVAVAAPPPPAPVPSAAIDAGAVHQPTSTPAPTAKSVPKSRASSGAAPRNDLRSYR